MNKSKIISPRPSIKFPVPRKETQNVFQNKASLLGTKLSQYLPEILMVLGLVITILSAFKLWYSLILTVPALIKLGGMLIELLKIDFELDNEVFKDIDQELWD